MTAYGIYSDKCKSGESIPCDAQKLRFNLIYTIGVFVNTVAPVFMGFFMDRFGPKMTNMIGASLYSIGGLLFTVSLLYDVDLIMPAFTLLGFAGPEIQMSVFHLSSLFPGYESSIMSTFSGVFPLSSLVFAVFESFYTWGLHLGYSFGAYILFMTPFFILGYFYFPFESFDSYEKAKPDTEQLIGAKVEKADMQNAPLQVQVRQVDLYLCGLFLALQSLRIALYIGTVNDRFADDKMYITAFSYIWPFGIIFTPVIGWILDKKGHAVSILILIIVSILYGILSLIPNDPVQFLTFFLLAFANVGNWGLVYSFIAHRFGFKHYGKLLGAVSIGVGIIGLLQYLFVYIAIELFDGDYFFVNLLLTVLTIPLLYVPYYIHKVSKL